MSWQCSTRGRDGSGAAGALATRAAESLVADQHTSIHSVLKVKTLPGAQP